MVLYAPSSSSLIAVDVATGTVMFRNYRLPGATDRDGPYALDALQLSPNGQTAIVRLNYETLMIDLTSGEVDRGLNAVTLPNGDVIRIETYSLTQDVLCFVARPTPSSTSDLSIVGTLDLATLDVICAYRESVPGWIEFVNCSPDGRFMSFAGYPENGGGYTFDLLDMTTGKSVIAHQESSINASPPQAYFSADAKTLAVFGQTGLTILDLAETRVLYQETTQRWHFSYGDYGMLSVEGYGHTGMSSGGDTAQRIFDVLLAPAALIDTVQESLAPDARAAIALARPAFPQ